MALAAALARAATRLLRGGGGAPPAASAAAVPGISLRIHRQLRGLSTADGPAAAGEADPWEEADAEILRDIEPVAELVKDILHSRRHPEFRQSRCLFVVRTDGDSEDFSYRRCLQAYIKEKYPSHADRFLQKYGP